MFSRQCWAAREDKQAAAARQLDKTKYYDEVQNWGPQKFGGPDRSSTSNLAIDGPDELQQGL
jgi:hypothetical protein